MDPSALPDAVLLNIIRHMDAFFLLVIGPRVSSRWRAQCLACPELDLSLFKSLKDEHLCVLLHRRSASHLNRISLRGLSYAITFRVIGKVAPGLNSLDVSECLRFSDASLQVVLAACPYLTSLAMSRCLRLTDQAMRFLGQVRPTLERLDIAGCSQATGAWMRPLLRLGKLQRLDISYCPKLKDADVAPLLASPSGRTGQGLQPPATGLSIQLPRLRSVSTAENEDMGEEGFEALGGCLSLEEVDVSHCQKLNGRALGLLTQRLTQLRVLRMQKCLGPTVNEGVRVLAGTCHGLEVLDVSTCRDLSEESLVSVGRQCPALLELVADDCPKAVTPATLQQLGASCARLTLLSACRCPQVTDAGLRRLAMGCPALRTVRLNGCSALTGAALQALGQHCRRLEALEVRTCCSIGDDGLEALAGLERLRAVDVSGCVGCTAAGLRGLVEARAARVEPSLPSCPHPGAPLGPVGAAPDRRGAPLGQPRDG
ncbi:putative leucine Rich Repeat family protein [Paratrimastix pyriformis]|uniref:Leucine Rich Repeat family protein n=1 Tax=Paratrimastix pyriformis TaxID=342808 RepID=A0ABQ8USG4_9EUKA|nr:putative leucine Rich Repeat family protein [Paratrimastix pyriformis]